MPSGRSSGRRAQNPPAVPLDAPPGVGCLAAASLDALASHIVTLAADGTILTVNAPWRQFAIENGGTLTGLGEGTNYFAVCEAVREPPADAADARAVATGVREVMAGRLTAFSYEYPCHAPGRQRWFQARVTPVRHLRAAAVMAHLEITDRRAAEAARAAAHRRFEALFEFAPDGLIITNDDGEITHLNQQAERMFGYAAHELDGRPVEVLVPGPFRHAHAASRQSFSRAPYSRVMGRRGDVLRAVRKDGSVFSAEISLGPFDVGTGLSVMAAVRDVTERRALEDQLRQAQKLETVGRLAGGIAHDFNNLLSIIGTSAELALFEWPDEAAVRADLDAIRSAATRAAILTQQLLAFGRRQILSPAVIDLNEVLASLAPMLERLIESNVRIVFHRSEDLWPVYADPTQIEQVIMNLAVNARDAMPEGGVLTIVTTNAAATDPEGAVVPCVKVVVRDTGAGMDEITRARIFEPFFTTKELGKGTGLGLATVYGVVKQCRGEITCESRPGEGTTFTICLPRGEGTPESTHADVEPMADPGGHETILLIEDEHDLRSTAERMLARAGYRVITAGNGDEALRLLEARREAVDLVVTDLMMPGMSGWEAAARIKEILDVRFVFTSGYSDDALRRSGDRPHAGRFLRKPYTLQQLARTVRDALDAPAG